jgi:hypothetical protein
MNTNDETTRKEVSTTIELQRSVVTVPSTPMADDQPDKLDFVFDDARLEAAVDREIKRSSETLANKFDALQRHLSDAAKIASQIKVLVQGEQT